EASWRGLGKPGRLPTCLTSRGNKRTGKLGLTERRRKHIAVPLEERCRRAWHRVEANGSDSHGTEWKGVSTHAHDPRVPQRSGPVSPGAGHAHQLGHAWGKRVQQNRGLSPLLSGTVPCFAGRAKRRRKKRG